MSGMQLNMNVSQRMEQTMRLAPRMIQSMEILQLPIMALEERIRQELDENPALELKEPTLEELQANEEAPAAEEKTPDPDGELVIDDAGELDFNRLEALSQDYGEAFNEEHRPSRNGMEDEGDRKHDAMSNMPSRPQSLNDYLSEQLTFIESAQQGVFKLLRNLSDRTDKMTEEMIDTAENLTLGTVRAVRDTGHGVTGIATGIATNLTKSREVRAV